jgi:tetratricopeptide (TPR) repeat protein
MPFSLVTPQWHQLCTALDREEDDPGDPDLLWLLHRLGLHKMIWNLPCDDMFSVYMHGIAWMSMYGDEATPDANLIESVAIFAPDGSWEAIEATYHMAAHSAKNLQDADAVNKWAEEHRVHIGRAEMPDNRRWMLLSRYHRVSAMEPMLRGDYDNMRHEMDAAQAWAEQLPRETYSERLIADVPTCAMWESRFRETMLIQDYQRAREYANNYVAVAPTLSLSHFCRGEALVELKSYALAADAYKKAARVGPPRTEAAMFMVGYCYEQLADFGTAVDWYMAALDLDPLGIGSLRALERVQLMTRDNGLLANWVRARIADLNA